MSNYSENNDYILFKVTKILPFFSVDVGLPTLCFHVLLSIICYIIYVWTLVCLIKYKKNLLELNETFCNTTIVGGFLDIITHVESVAFNTFNLYPPVSELLKDLEDLSFIWTIYYSSMYFFPFCQFFLCTYIAFQRFVIIFYPFKGENFLKATFIPFLALMFVTSLAPTWYLWNAPIFFNQIPTVFTNGYVLRVLNYKKKDWMNNPSNSRNSIIHYSTFIGLAFFFNIISSGKILVYNYKQVKKSGENSKQKKVNLNMLLYSICTTFTQFLFVAINCVWYFVSTNAEDPSFYYLCYVLRLYVIHLICLTQPFYLFWLSKKVRALILRSIGIKAEISNMVGKSTTRARVTVKKN
uniref:Serpentine receptor class gamma n=1 Tax=Strongyloides venezuelensis TaxID=75913 RepID=A0A0K0FW19_STRVS